MAIREKQIPYAVTLERDGSIAAEGNEPIRFEEEWTPEHLLLAALARCCVGAFRIHANRHSLELVGSWGFLELECRAEIQLLPQPDEEVLQEVIEKAERGCFIGGSLRPEPVYAWTVNGREVRR